MIVNRVIVVLFLSFCAIMSYSQKVKLSGYVLDKDSGESLVGANVHNTTSTSGCITNKYGYYSFYVDSDKTNEIKYSYIGYNSKIIYLKLKEDSIVNIRLALAEVELGEVFVYVNEHNKIEDEAAIGKTTIHINEIKQLPSISGEPDILKALQLFPGIQSGTEGNNGLFVRGGTPDQNLFLLDNVPLYNVSHLGGLFSIFDPSMVKSIDLYKGGFPARYGGRLSSISDIRTRDGDLYSYSGEIGVSTLISKVFLEGPISKENSSFVFSSRISNLGLYSFIYKNLLSDENTQKYSFYDINLKINLKLSDKNRIFLSLYQGRDLFSVKEKDNSLEHAGITYESSSQLFWGNSAASAKWTHIIKENVFNTMTLAYTRYIYNNHNYFSRTLVDDDFTITDDYKIMSGVNDLILKNDAEFSFEKSQIKLGAEISKHFYIPSAVNYSQLFSSTGDDSIVKTPGVNSNEQAFNIYGYGEWEYKIGDKVKFNIGLRTGINFTDSVKYPSFDPRLIFNYRFLPSVSLKLSYCQMQQNLHFLTNSNTGLPTDIWVPSTALLKPETSKQFSIGLAHTTNSYYEVSVELYSKNTNNLIEYKEGILVYNSSMLWEEKVVKDGEGKTQGMELLLRKKSGRFTGWVGYALTSSKRSFSEINKGEEFPFKYDQRHNITFVSVYNLNKYLSFSCTWVFHSGNRITMPVAMYKLKNINYSGSYEGDRIIYNDVHIYSERNAYQMPAYHRLDIGLNYLKQKRKGTSKWSLNIYNAYNRKNAYYLFFKESDNGEIKLYQQSLFPILLNFGYSFIY